MRQYRVALHLFHRDLRLEDNTGLIYALAHAKKVIPCFIFDYEQIENNEYRCDNAVQFMLDSLIDLDSQLKKKGGKLYLFYGSTYDILQKILEQLEVDLLTSHRDYTPFAEKRDKKIKQFCDEVDVEYLSFGDILLNEPEQIHKDDGKPYSIFTPFFRKAKLIPVRKPQKNVGLNYYTKDIDLEQGFEIFEKILPKRNDKIFLRGGRKNGLKLLRAIELLGDYEVKRDYPAKDYTSHLSAHNKFGTVSIREVYYASQHVPVMIKELYWRDFFVHIAFHHPHVFGNPFYKKYVAIKWSHDHKKFDAWCTGMTGFPIVDAGMRQLNETGYMHNRVRMITASFLVKDLHIDWRWGEKYFAQKLIDYDPCVNNGNWQWAASTGCDAQPYFRIFNPWRQQKRFDAECEYIKRWVFELRDALPKDIHASKKIKGYLEPIVEHKLASLEAKEMYSSLS